MITVIVGSFIAFGILFFALIGGGNSSSYIDGFSFLLVFGGSVSASLMSISWENLKELKGRLVQTFLVRPTDDKMIREELILVSQKAAAVKHIGQLSHESTNIFIAKGIRLLQSDIDQENIHKILSEMINSEKTLAMRSSDMIRSMAKYPPAFGMIGTILGLIGLMEEIGLSTGMDKIGSKMAIALITTLYGLLLANYLLVPLAEIILNRAQTELKIKKKILDTFVMISGNRHDPVLVNEFLTSGVQHPTTETYNSEAA